ncbi:hypothetical protein DFH01_27530 [Falsiroseomonas bella]|uniref:Ice-binding protein C-terminal domain-containing protein n=1 Tax=Falsiroseomonas bella TaxID=2184016 RepID=A0A317F4L3_9PROT|nr:hypothetical protein DFH01_27530 [Falsiroseomonas bella]
MNGTPIVPSGSTGIAYADPGQTRGYLTGSTAIAGQPTSVALSYPAALGVPNPTVISFEGFDFTNAGVQTAFVIGRFTFTNGAWFGAGQTTALNTPTVLGFTLTTTGTGGAATLFTQRITGEITLTVNNPQPADYTSLAGQQAEADWISLRTIPSSATLRPIPSFHVYDSYAKPSGATNTGSVDLVAAFGSLYLVALDNPTGGAFLTEVPEPATLSLLGAGLLGLAVARRRRR